MQYGLNGAMRESLAARLKAARKAAGLTQVQLAERAGVNQSDISKIERGATLTPAGLVEIAAALGVDPMWLKSGDGDPKASNRNVLSVTTRGKVPLISWVAAGNLGEVEDMFAPGEADEWIDCSETQTGRHAFALRVDGESMTSPYPTEISFPSGTIIVVDPDRSAGPGDFVVAKDVTTQQATFKKLVHDGGRWYLKPLNPGFPTIEIDDPALRVIGRVVEFQYRRKL
jgi:SOS-response transcriptional repressor LexA